MKIALAQLNYHIGNFEENTSKIKAAIQKALGQKVDLIVFSELCVCGYPPKDLLEFDNFIRQCEDSVNEIAKTCKGIAAIIGAPSVNRKEKGKKLHNTAFFIENGIVKHQVHKTLLPDYDVFDEYRYFEPNTAFNLIEYKGIKVALTICEDLWTTAKKPLYTSCPMDILATQTPEVIINIAASPFAYDHANERLEVLVKNALKHKVPVFYMNQLGAQTDLIFDGGGMVVTANGKLYDELSYFKEDFRIYDTDTLKKGTTPFKPYRPSKASLIHDALILGIRDYFRKSGFRQALIGSSGGIDSALVTALAAEALGSDNIKTLLMPSPFSSGHSVTDAVKLAENLNAPYEIMKIKDPYQSFESTLQPFFKDLPFDVTEENIQSRIRGILLMAFSNKFNYILLNTSNKSELATGYGTLYGDMCGGLSILGDVYKTEIYEVANYINREKEIIPSNILEKAPSAELRPNQKDTDTLPGYDVLDKILYRYIEERKDAAQIIAEDFEETLVERILRMININEHKRYQFAPILRVSRKAFGTGRRIPIVAKH